MVKLNVEQKKEIIEYLSNELYVNTYILGDIEYYGMNSDIVSVFADRYHNFGIIVMRYQHDYVVYSKDSSFNKKEVVEFLVKDSTPTSCISGKADTICLLHQLMEDWAIRETKISSYAFADNINPINWSDQCTILSSSYAESLLELYLSIDEFASKFSRYSVDDMEALFDGGHIVGLLSEKGQLIASAASTAESNTCAMITNVCVLPQYRNKGLAFKVVSSLLSVLQEKGLQTVSLYYDNPFAAKLYEQIGFKYKSKYSTMRHQGEGIK